MSTSIFTFTHKTFTPPNNDTYIPLQVGAAVNEDLGYMTDATGENISSLNKYYGELTGMYWIWKNYTASDYIGMCHYRRFFLDEQRHLLTERKAEDILKEYDIIVSNRVLCNTDCYFNDFTEAHGPDILKFTGEAIRQTCPEYYETYHAVFSENESHYGNLMIMPHDYFNQYAEWLFGIFDALTPMLHIDFTDLYHQRVFGFISENMITVWARHNKLTLYECPIGITAEKAETTEFKLAMSQLFKIRQTETAAQMFYEYVKVRPDVRLPLSDILGEIPVIEQLIYICNLEKADGLSNTLDFSTNLKELINLYQTVKAEVLNNRTEFVIEHNVSLYMIHVILKNTDMDCTKRTEAMQFYERLYS